MTMTQVVTTNSLSKDYLHPDDPKRQTTIFYVRYIGYCNAPQTYLAYCKTWLIFLYALSGSKCVICSLSD